LYTTAPYFDSQGVLYKYAGQAQSTLGYITRDNVIKMVYPAGGSSFGEEIYFANGNNITNIVYQTSSIVLVADGGASAGTILGQCGVSFSSGGGSSGLSSGAIAGIVIGSVVGGLLVLLALVTACFVLGRKGKKEGRAAEPSVQQSGAGYASQRDDQSRLEHSQVELQPGTHGEEITA